MPTPTSRSAHALMIGAVLVLLCLCSLLVSSATATAQSGGDTARAILNDNSALISKSSRRTVGPAIDALAGSGLPEAADILNRWQNRELYTRSSDGMIFRADEQEDRSYILRDVITGEEAGTAGRRDVKQIRPNAGVRRLIASALVSFELIDPDPSVRRASLEAIERSPEPGHLPALRRAIEVEGNAELKALMERRERILSVLFEEGDARITAIRSLEGDLSIDARATLNPLVAVTMVATKDGPGDRNIARTLIPGDDLSYPAAYAYLNGEGLVPDIVTEDVRNSTLEANILDGAIAGIAVSTLNTDAARDDAYARLVDLGAAEPTLTSDQRQALVDEYTFYDVYSEPPQVTEAALVTIRSIERSVDINEALDLTLDALSLASIYFLAAIGLAITFGVMGVINMAHGEFIMMGAYTGFVVQQFVPNYTLSLVLALPLAFMVTFAAGVLLERLVIRWLYDRPLETLLATFGVSIALQQLAKNIFGTQARPLTAPEWLDGAIVVNDVLAISTIRIAIFVLGAIFFIALLFTLNRTRLGLEVRAVRQNPRMASAMGINRERVNMLTFGLGSGIAGIAGVAIGLFAKVTSDLGSSYIVQSFMTVVVGGVGNIWGTLAGATLIGFLQKFIEWWNPSNTLAAQTYMIVFVIIFIQFRPRGIVALRGRAAEA